MTTHFPSPHAPARDFFKSRICSDDAVPRYAAETALPAPRSSLSTQWAKHSVASRNGSLVSPGQSVIQFESAFAFHKRSYVDPVRVQSGPPHEGAWQGAMLTGASSITLVSGHGGVSRQSTEQGPVYRSYWEALEFGLGNSRLANIRPRPWFDESVTAMSYATDEKLRVPDSGEGDRLSSALEHGGLAATSYPRFEAMPCR